jgi:hypothetical protein
LFFVLPDSTYDDVESMVGDSSKGGRLEKRKQGKFEQLKKRKQRESEQMGYDQYLAEKMEMQEEVNSEKRRI